ncbi:MAG: DUF3810 domain-containing protein, partial [Sediminibacterium sp.]
MTEVPKENGIFVDMKIFFVCLALALLFMGFGYFPAQVEEWYSGQLYPVLLTLRLWLTAWVPFSIGDLLYVIIFIYLIYKLIRNLININKEGVNRGKVWRASAIVLLVWISFKLLWGLNYDRLGAGHLLDIEQKAYSRAAVDSLVNELIDSLNSTRKQIIDAKIQVDTLPVGNPAPYFSGAQDAYQTAKTAYTFLPNHAPKVKATLFNPLADYVGFTGYFNPFTAEGQVRTDMPGLELPFVACHETAHMLGFASESEANLIGYLVATKSTNPYVRYSAYNEIFTYAQREQFVLLAQQKDSVGFMGAVAHNRARLDTLVKQDRKAVRNFFNKHRSSVAPIMSGVYEQYLFLNKQNAGLKSYDEVIGWLIDLKRKQQK